MVNIKYIYPSQMNFRGCCLRDSHRSHVFCIHSYGSNARRLHEKPSVVGIFTALALLFLQIFLQGICQAAEIKVLGLFPDKAFLEVDGTRKIIKVGDKLGEVELLSANSKTCVIKTQGQVRTLGLSSDISIQFMASSDPVVRLSKDEQGMYRSEGKINGQPVKFLIDTGATQLALNQNLADQLKIDYQPDKHNEVSTASGKAKAYSVILRTVSIGGITVYDVPALVVEGASPEEVLLGMSFLKRIEMDNKGSVLELKKKY